jgi:hypothetical protein
MGGGARLSGCCPRPSTRRSPGGLLDHRRLRLPRLGRPGGARALHLRRLLHQPDLEPARRARERDRRAARSDQNPSPLFIWRGRAWGAVCGLARRRIYRLSSEGAGATPESVLLSWRTEHWVLDLRYDRRPRPAGHRPGYSSTDVHGRDIEVVIKAEPLIRFQRLAKSGCKFCFQSRRRNARVTKPFHHESSRTRPGTGHRSGTLRAIQAVAEGESML